MKTRNNKRIYDLIFDVETTGLPPPGVSSLKPEISNREYEALAKPRRREELYPHRYTNVKEALDQYPYITQFSWILVEKIDNTVNIVDMANDYVQLPPSVVVSPFIEQLTGVSNTLCRERGKPIVEVLVKFVNTIVRCDSVVGHNISFDRTMVRVEIERNKDCIRKHIPYIDCIFHPAYDTLVGIHHYDTMMRTIKICRIHTKTSLGNIKLKPPKLIELYQILFHETPVKMHDSIVDTLICMRCYLKIKYHWDMEDERFEQLLHKFNSAIDNKHHCPTK